MANTDETASNTSTLTTDISNGLWRRLAAIAIADGIHDDVIVNTDTYGLKTGSTALAAKQWQCNRFCRALPPNTPQCNATAGGTGLLIDDMYKRASFNNNGIEENIFNMVCPSTLDFIQTHNGAVFHTNINDKIYTTRTVRWGVGAGIVAAGHGSVCGQGLMQSLDMRDGSAILLDAENNGIIKKFKEGGISAWRLYFLMLPEWLADSASRKRWKRSSMFTQTAGIKWSFAGKYRAEYPPWSNAARNAFFSAYSCDMITDWAAGTCRQIWRLPGVAAPVYDTPNAHRDNNKTNVINFNPADTVANANIISLKYQRKRSGDQLQALALKRLQNTTTFNISTDGNNPPVAGSNYNGQLRASGAGGAVINPKGESYLITHDQTLLAYALHLGINVIFTRSNGGIKTAISFKIATAGAAGNLNDNIN
jgi:hypothetical protein